MFLNTRNTIKSIRSRLTLIRTKTSTLPVTGKSTVPIRKILDSKYVRIGIMQKQQTMMIQMRFRFFSSLSDVVEFSSISISEFQGKPIRLNVTKRPERDKVVEV